MKLGAEVQSGGTWFRVWAPRPRTLELEIAGSGRLAVPRDESGFGELRVDGVGDGARYVYLLDGERRRPDPASRSQPDGVHAPSQVIDPLRFSWSDERFVQPPLDAIYELHVGAFSTAGTFDGVSARLDALRASGFRVVELMPVSAFPGARNWGYDGVSLRAPHSVYGGPERLRSLVDACHRAGVAVILDVVLNHLGPEGNYLAEFGPYFSARHTPWGPALDLHGANAGPVRAFLIDSARSLVEEFHLDGVRLDAVHAFVDDSPIHFVAELAATLHADAARRGRPVWVIAESDLGIARVVEPADAGGWGCDAMWADDFHHALHALLTGERSGYYADFGDAALLARALERGLVHTGRPTPFRRRRFGEPTAHLDGKHLVVCAQNHDQVGNRARGDRLAALVPGCEFAVAAALLTAPFLPLVFMGEEYGETAPFPYFTSFTDPELGRAVSEERRRELGPGAPDPQAASTFFEARLDPARAGARGESLRRWHRALLDLRRTRPSLHETAAATTEAVADGETLVVRRLARWDETLAVYRLSASAATIAAPAPRYRDWRVLLDAGDFGGPRGAACEGGQIRLPGYGALVLGAP